MKTGVQVVTGVREFHDESLTHVMACRHRSRSNCTNQKALPWHIRKPFLSWTMIPACSEA